jgi:ribose/xylose/arabinose/galactoside ABC-type transport system permease subunit
VKLSPVARRVLLIVHIAVSVGWMGAAAAYVVLNIPALTGADEQSRRAAYLMMPVVADYALVPLAVATVVTGVALALGTKWGLLQHYWVTVSLVVTLFAAGILLLHLPAVDEYAAVAADRERDVSAIGGDLFHSIGGLVVLTVPLVLNVVKPRGLTRRGWRVQRGRRGSATT